MDGAWTDALTAASRRDGRAATGRCRYGTADTAATRPHSATAIPWGCGVAASAVVFGQRAAWGSWAARWSHGPPGEPRGTGRRGPPRGRSDTRPAARAVRRTTCRAHENARRNCWERRSERSAAGLDVIAACLVRSGANPARAVKLSPDQRRRCRDHSQPRLTDPTAPSGKTKCMRRRRATQATYPPDSARTRSCSPPTWPGCGRSVDSRVRPLPGQHRWAGPPRRRLAETPAVGRGQSAAGYPSPGSHPDGVRRLAAVFEASRNPAVRRIVTGCPSRGNQEPTTWRRPALGQPPTAELDPAPSPWGSGGIAALR